MSLYFMVHSCEDGTFDHEERCDAVFVWAETESDAIKTGQPFTECGFPESLRAEPMPELANHRNVLGDVKALHQMSSVLDDRALRDAHFGDDPLTSCDSCGLYQFDSMPESKVCEDCLQCRECGCCDHCEASECDRNGCRPGCPHISPNGDRGIQKS